MCNRCSSKTGQSQKLFAWRPAVPVISTGELEKRTRGGGERHTGRMGVSGRTLSSEENGSFARVDDRAKKVGLHGGKERGVGFHLLGRR